MTRTIVASLGVLLCACANGSQPNVDRVNEDVRYYTLQVQHRTDAPARVCHRAITAAAIATANVLVPLRSGEGVSAQLYSQLSAADQDMKEKCRQFR